MGIMNIPDFSTRGLFFLLEALVDDLLSLASGKGEIVLFDACMGEVFKLALGKG